MSRPEQHAGHRRRPAQGPKRREEPKQFPWKAVAITASVFALIGATFVVPGLFQDDRAAVAGHSTHQTGAGDGPDLGSRIAFDERNVMDGSAISSQSLRGRRTLLFFSEGVMCQACFEQIRDIESVGTELESRGIGLVSITPDPSDTLRQSIDDYGISTPMISDENRDMSAAFDTLGQGMHADTPGHAFVLLDRTGKVVWKRDYWLAPYRTMYVEPAKLLADLTLATAA